MYLAPQVMKYASDVWSGDAGLWGWAEYSSGAHRLGGKRHALGSSRDKGSSRHVSRRICDCGGMWSGRAWDPSGGGRADLSLFIMLVSFAPWSWYWGRGPGGWVDGDPWSPGAGLLGGCWINAGNDVGRPSPPWEYYILVPECAPLSPPLIMCTKDDSQSLCACHFLST